MYITKVEDILNKYIDNFYDILNKNNITNNILNDVSFVKYQNEINSILMSYIDTIYKNIDNLTKNDKHKYLLFEMTKKYIAYYFFILIAFFYLNKQKIYVNNIVEFTINQGNYKLKINDFFNSQSNSNLIKYFEIIKNIITYSKSQKNKIDLKLNDLEAQILKELEKENILSITEKYNSKLHNIIKIIILIIFNEEDKKDIYQSLEDIEKETREYTYIDVIYPKKKIIELDTIENILTIQDIKKGMSDDFYSMIFLLNTIKNGEYTKIEENIIDLINNKILIPIVDDFLLYHKKNIKYKYDNTDKQNKDDTYLKYITDKIDTTSELYSENVKTNITLQNKIKQNFSQTLFKRQAILINYLEDVKLINKLKKLMIRNNEQQNLFNEYLSYMKYPYINFKDFEEKGFSLQLNKSIDVVRNITFKNDKNDIIQFRTGSDKSTINIVGFLLPKNKISFKCSKVGNINKLKNKQEFDDKLMNNFFEKKTNNYYWNFNTLNIEDKNTAYSNEHIKILTSNLHVNIQKIVYNKIINIFNKYKNIPIYYSYKIKNEIEKNSIYLNDEFNSDLENIIFFEKNEIKKNNYDLKSDILYGSLHNKIILPNYSNKKIKLKSNSDKILNVNKTCQHIITFYKISELKNDIIEYKSFINYFMDKYVIYNKNGEYICKSCSGKIELFNTVTDWKHESDNINENIYYNKSEISLEELSDYNKYENFIKIVDRLIDRFANIFNIQLLIGKNNTSIKFRGNLIKNIIDTIKIKKININKNYYSIITELKLNNNIMTNIKDNTNYIIEYNIIISYIVIEMIMNMNEFNIYSIKNNKNCNYNLFEKYIYNIFSNVNIIKNKTNETTFISNYKVLCYLIYQYSCILIKYKYWKTPLNTNTLNKKELNKEFSNNLKIIIHTIIDGINLILKNKKEDHIFHQLNTIFKNSKILEKITNKKKDTELIYENKNILTEIGIIKKIIYTPIILNKYVSTKYRVKYNYNTRNYKNNVDYNTNCKDGKFHKWKYINNKLQCELCNVYYDISSNNKDISIIKLNLKHLKYFNLNKYTKNKNDKFEDINKKIIFDKKKKHIEYILNQKKIINTKLEEVHLNKKILNNLHDKYSKYKNKLEFINDFINKIKSITGNKVDGIELELDIFIINNNYLGYKLETPLIFNENDKNFINDVENNQYIFKITKPEQINMYYDTSSLIYKGYKQQHKEFINMSKKKQILSISPSLRYMLINLGNPLNLKKKLCANRQQIINLKKTIYKFNLLINQIKYKYNPYEKNINVTDYYVDLLKKYIDKLSNVVLHDIFNDWKVINNNMTNYKDDIELHNNLLLFYIISELSKLIDINNNKFAKINITIFIADIMNNLFYIFNENIQNIEIKRLQYIPLKEKQFDENFTESFDDEIHNIKENTEDSSDEGYAVDIYENDSDIDND
jgi:hypothetical protein